MTRTDAIGIIQDVRYLDHRIDRPSKECPGRIQNLYLDIDRDHTLANLLRYTPREASDEQILHVHSELYLQQVNSHALNEDPYSYDADTYLMQDSPYVARLAAGGCLTLMDAVMNREINTGFALVRPPGHHAETGRGMGFCIYNNIAITAQYLIDEYAINRILIIDFDTHHGNGTQDIFYDTNQVLTLSVHQQNLFPFGGAAAETGTGAGEGYNINIPVPAQFGDIEYSCIFGTAVQNVIEHYLPEVILVSAGYDAHIDDPISQTHITTDGFYEITQAIKYFAESIAQSRLLFVLEGGYNIDVLSQSVHASLNALHRQTIVSPGFKYAPRALQAIENSWPPELLQRWGLSSILL